MSTVVLLSSSYYKSLIGLSPLHRSVSLFLLRSLLAKRVDIDIDRDVARFFESVSFVNRGLSVHIVLWGSSTTSKMALKGPPRLLTQFL